MVEIFNVGSEELISELEVAGFKWVVYWYETGDWDGSGEAVGYKDGLLYIKNLSHCSCYGPMDDGLESGDKMTVEAFLSLKEDIFSYDARKEVKKKVAELIGYSNAPVFEEKLNFFIGL